jgi:anti-sigma factor RsiW
VIGHLGPRVSALLDGRLSEQETERAWAHVHVCHACRDLVEREGWVKTRLAGLSGAAGGAPAHLKGSLLGGEALATSPREAFLGSGGTGSRVRRTTGVVALGGGAVGVAVLGVLALGTLPSDGPVDRRAPVTNLVRPPETPRLVTPTLTPSPPPRSQQRTP